MTMRVLVVCIPQAGHLTPLLPLASALAAQGDEVAVASGPDVAEAVATAGLRFIPRGRGLAQWFPTLAHLRADPPTARTGRPPHASDSAADRAYATLPTPPDLSHPWHLLQHKSHR